MTTHEQYIPQEYGRSNFARGFEAPPRSPIQYAGQMTSYQQQPPPPHPAAMIRPYAQSQPYQQNQAALEPIHDNPKPRRHSAADRERYQPRDEREDESDSESEEQRYRTTGGPLAGAASGALLGANVGGGKGCRAAGTIGGIVAGAWAGSKAERAFKSKRREKHNAEQEVVNSAQQAQDSYDNEYTKVAYAAPGYGSSLLPGDTSHGGSLNRNSRASPS